MTKIGVMLYTVREQCAHDLAGTLNTIARLGYQGVELFDLHGHTPREVQSLLDRSELTLAARHVAMPELETSLAGLEQECSELGCDRVVLSWIEPPTTIQAANAAVQQISSAAKRTRMLGLRLGFHNHAAELTPLEDGVTFLERLATLPRDLLWFEIDLGWCWDAGFPAERLLGWGRSPLVHVKDLRARGTREHCPVGEGSVDYPRTLPQAVACGVEWLLVEQDVLDRPAEDALACSLHNINSMLQSGQ